MPKTKNMPEEISEIDELDEDFDPDSLREEDLAEFE